MPERMNAVAVAVAVRHAIAGDLDPKRTLDVLHERMGGKQRMAKADLARLVLLCADNLDGELEQARRQIPRCGKGKVAGHIKRPVNVQQKAACREACGNDLVAQLVGLRRADRGGSAHALNSA